MAVILSWNVEKLLNTFNAMIDEKDNALIEYFGRDNWNELVNEANGDTEAAMEWVRFICHSKVEETYQLLQTIYNETKDIPIVQKRLEAIGIKDSN